MSSTPPLLCQRGVDGLTIVFAIHVLILDGGKGASGHTLAADAALNPIYHASLSHPKIPYNTRVLMVIATHASV